MNFNDLLNLWGRLIASASQTPCLADILTRRIPKLLEGLRRREDKTNDAIVYLRSSLFQRLITGCGQLSSGGAHKRLLKRYRL